MNVRPSLMIAGIWMLLGLIYSGQSFFYSLSVGREYVWQRSLFHSFVFCLEWGLLTVPVLRLAEKFRLDGESFLRNLPIHLLLGGVIALVQQTVYVLTVDVVEGGGTFTRSWSGYLPSIIGFFEYGVLMYWSIVFVHHATRYYRRFREEEQNTVLLRTQLAESQLQALKMQLQPHFLFNTLNAISVLVKKEPALAQKMIVRLSDLLRLTLERGNENRVTLGQELEFLSAYLAIEKVRFGDRLLVRTDIGAGTHDCFVPTFILQPLVENSLRHGIAQRSGEGWIIISSALSDGHVMLTVRDGGKKSSKRKPVTAGTGIGLENTRRRLQTLYGDNASLAISSNEENGFTVVTTLPAERT